MSATTDTEKDKVQISHEKPSWMVGWIKKCSALNPPSEEILGIFIGNTRNFTHFYRKNLFALTPTSVVKYESLRMSDGSYIQMRNTPRLVKDRMYAASLPVK